MAIVPIGGSAEIRRTFASIGSMPSSGAEARTVHCWTVAGRPSGVDAYMWTSLIPTLAGCTSTESVNSLSVRVADWTVAVAADCGAADRAGVVCTNTEV